LRSLLSGSWRLRNEQDTHGLVTEVEKNFEALKGTVLEGVTYEPENENHSAEIEALNEKVIAPLRKLIFLLPEILPFSIRFFISQ
jgi:hypothetical protein